MPSDERAWRAPGRVNIIGEHIDYVGGTVLPFACDRELVVTARRSDGPVELEPVGEAPPSYRLYIDGVLTSLRRAGYEIGGCVGEIRSTIPVGAGLSSSAALCAAVALAVTGGQKPPPSLLQEAEHLATGVPCGVMDPTAVLEARVGAALLLDCGSGAFEHVAIPPEVAFVVVDTGSRRQLADGRYARRRAEVETGHPARMRHVRSEQARVHAAVAALAAADVAALGEILNESHASLRDDFEVSSEALDRAAEVASSHHACHGSRLVGAGFAGCVLCAVEAGAEDDVVSHVKMELEGADAFGVSAVAGAGPV